MRKILIAVNCILSLILVGSVWEWCSGSNGEQLEIGKKKDRTEKTLPGDQIKKNQLSLPNNDKSAKLVVEKNIFDPQRGGGMTAGRGAPVYSLVGVYQVGSSQGAIILTKGGPRSNTPVKQYYQLGDVLPNGYELSEISPMQAVFSKGASRMVLNLAQASENIPKSRPAVRQPSQMQQMINLMNQSVRLQQQQQQQQNNMLQMMHNNQNNNVPVRSGSSNRRPRTR